MGYVGYQVVFYRVHYDTHGIDVTIFELSITATFYGSFSFLSSNSGFTIYNTLFLARMRSILVFHALKLEAPSNLFSDFME
jgi:hypothetical protein